MAISRLLSDPKTLDKGVVLIGGNVAFGAAGAVGTVEAKGVSVAKTGTGVYVLTMPGTGTVNVLSCQLTYETTGTELFAYISARSDAARTITVTLKDLDTPAATDAASGDVLHFLVWVKNSSVN